MRAAIQLEQGQRWKPAEQYTWIPAREIILVNGYVKYRNEKRPGVPFDAACSPKAMREWIKTYRAQKATA